MAKARKTRKDCTVGTFLKKNGLPGGSLRHRNGRAIRKDALIGNIAAKK